MKNHLKRLLFSRDEGFSYPELLISLVLLSFISLFMVRFFYTHKSFLESAVKLNNSASASLLVAFYLKEELNHIDQPWTEETFDYLQTHDEYRFYWYMGLKEDSLALKNEAGSLLWIVRQNGVDTVIHHIKGYRIEKVELVESNNTPYCMKFVLIAEDSQSREVIIPLRTIPIVGSNYD
ncbi:MAG: hypothetical protein PQJ59_09625 [Spirochaetales bacterium]|nr:hypothetical protein [Spirochaetales bacterium]